VRTILSYLQGLANAVNGEAPLSGHAEPRRWYHPYCLSSINLLAIGFLLHLNLWIAARAAAGVTPQGTDETTYDWYARNRCQRVLHKDGLGGGERSVVAFERSLKQGLWEAQFFSTPITA
jgi:hypothetical protein